MLRVSLVTLGVENVPKASRFYEAFGLTRSPFGGDEDSDSVAFFQLGPVVLSLFGREALREDGQADRVWTGNGGIALARNVGSEGGRDHSEAAAKGVLGRLSRLFRRSRRPCLGGRAQSRLQAG